MGFYVNHQSEEARQCGWHTHFLTSITSNSRFSFPIFRSRYGSSFGIKSTKPLETLTRFCGDFFSFTSSPLFMPTMSTSVPSTNGFNGAPGASMQRVTSSFGRESAAVSAVFVVPAFGKSTADSQSQDATPEALIPQEPFAVGRTWASPLWPLSKINKQNAVTYRIASPLGSTSRNEVYTLASHVSFCPWPWKS